MLLQTYHFKVISPPCEPGAEKWTAIAQLDDDIGEVLPYLNATLKRAIYNHPARALTWRMGGHSIAIRPREIAISNLPDQENAAVEMKRVVDLINRTWERRAEITPSLEMRQRLKPMEVYKALACDELQRMRAANLFHVRVEADGRRVRTRAVPVTFHRNLSREARKVATTLGRSGQLNDADDLYLPYHRCLER